MKSLFWNKLSAKTLIIQKLVNTNKANQSTGFHTTRAPIERYFVRDIVIHSKIPLSKRLHHTESHQVARNVNQLTNRHEPPPNGISEQTIVIIVSKYSSTKIEPALADIYAIKLQYNQKLIHVKNNNVKDFLQYLAQKVLRF